VNAPCLQGDSGYFKLKANAGVKGGLCGIATAASYPIKTSPNPRVPLMCDPFGWSECPSGSSCSCAWPFFFNLFCIKHDCCPLRHGVGCADNLHCCPYDAPVCDTDKGTCSATDGSKTVQWTEKSPAKYEVAAGAVEGDDQQAVERFYRGMQVMRNAAQKPELAQQAEKQVL